VTAPQPGQHGPAPEPDLGTPQPESSEPEDRGQPGQPEEWERPDEPEEPLAERAGATGHPTVDAALASLDEAAALPPEDQVTAYEQAHRVLRETLSTILVPAPSNQPAKPTDRH
jgi:hypothetical protein